MEIFKTTAVLDNDPEFTFVCWGSSQTEAAAHRKRFKEAYGPECVVTTQTVNIPTAKGPLVAWLKANVLS